MATKKPVIELAIDVDYIHQLEDRGIEPGTAIAEILRASADQIEKDISVVPYGSGEWIRESHSYPGVELVLEERDLP